MKKPFRDQLRENDASLNHWAIMTGKETPARLLNNVPEKRAYVRSEIPTEHNEQVTVMHWWRHAHHGFNVPEFALFAIPNGGQRDPIIGARMKAEGVRPAIPDLMLAVQRGTQCGLFIEVKRLNTYANADQKAVGAYLMDAGYAWRVCQGNAPAIAEIQRYLKGN